MPRILNIKPNIILSRKPQRSLHMPSLSRINNIQREIPNRAAIFPRIRIPPVLVLFGYGGRQLLSVQVRSPALAGSAA